MSLEPLPLDRKIRERERKHERSESLGSVARWRGSSSHHHRSQHEYNRSGNYRRLSGHGKQGGWQLFPEEYGHEHVFPRSCDKKLEEDNRRPSLSRGDGKYERSNKESRGAFNHREWRGRSSETANISQNMSRRQTDATNDRKSVDDMLTYSSHPNSNLVNTWEQHHMKDQHNKMGGVNRFGTGQRCDKDSSLSTIDWKPLKWTRPGCSSSRESGFSHSNGTRRLGETNSKGSRDGKDGLQQKITTADESKSGEAAACRTSSAPSDETNSRKKPRLNWGEGLAKFEKKRVEGPEVTSNKDGPVSPPFNMEPSNFLSPNLVDKSLKVSGLSDCASPATPNSAACSSSPGTDDKRFGKAANVESDVSNLSSSPGSGSQSHLQIISRKLEKVDNDSLASLAASLVALLPQSGIVSSVDYSLLSSTTMNKLLTLKAGISKVLEVTETEIDLLENELRSLKSESEGRFPCSAAVGSLLCCNAKSCDKHDGCSDKDFRLDSLQIVSSDDSIVEKMPLSANLLDVHDNCQEKDIDSPGLARSKDLVGTQSRAVQCLIPCTYKHAANISACGDSNSSLEVKDGVDAKSSASFYSSTEDVLYDTIISCNKKTAKAASEVFAKLLPANCGKNGNIGASSGSCSDNAPFIMAKLAEKRRFAKLKERVIALKFKALHHLWKEDMCLLSNRKRRPKSHKKLESDLHAISNSHQKKRSSIPFRFPFPGNQLTLVPTSEMVNYTSQVLSQSKHESHRSTLKMPALILDQKDKMNSKFLSSNGLIEDPLAIEKERAMVNPWTSEEKDIFLEKFAAFGKDFRKIATFLDHKTTADCVEFYYKNHKSDCFEKIKKEDDKLGKFLKAKTDLMASGMKWNTEVNASSLDILSAASVMADGIECKRKMRSGSSLWRGYGNMVMSRGDDVNLTKKRDGKIITERPNSFEVRDERETVAADVLASICGCISSEATASSCITSSVVPVGGKRVRKGVKGRSLYKQPVMPDITQNVDPEICSDESYGEMDRAEWSDGEMDTFLQAVSSFGKDFSMISRRVSTKSPHQCKAFFSKASKRLTFLGQNTENNEPLVNDDVDGGRGDSDNACVVETGSANGSDMSGTKTDVIQPVEASNLSADLDESVKINGKVVHEDVNMVSNACVIGGESKLGTDGNVVVLYSSDSIEIGKDKTSEGGGAVTELVSGTELIEPRHSNSVVEGRLVSNFSSGHQGDEAATDVVIELKDNIQDLGTLVNTSLSSVEVFCPRLSVAAEIDPQPRLEKPHFLGVSEGPLTNANSILKYTDAAAVQYKKTTSQDLPACDFQGNLDLNGHISSSNLGYQRRNPGSLLDPVEAARLLQSYHMQVPDKKKVDLNMSYSSSATELPLLPQKIEQRGDHKSLQCSSDSEKKPRGDVKIFGKILTIPPGKKPYHISMENEENGTHHPMLSSVSPNLKLTSHDNVGEKSATSKVSQVIENVPVLSIPTMPDSAILLAKYPAAFSSYPTSAKLEQESLQALAKNDKQHLGGASTFTTKEINGSNGVIDYQMFKERGDLNAKPFTGDEMHRQNVFSDMQRKTGFEGISSLLKQGNGMVGTNGVGKPGTLVGGSNSGVSDPVAAIKMHHSIADQFVDQTGSAMKEDESLGGK